MGVATRGKLIRKIKVRDLRELIAVPTEQRGSFEDGYDGQFVVVTGRNRRRVALAISSGCELVFPEWLRESILADTSPDDDVAIYLSTRPIWLVPDEQAEAIAGIVARHGPAADSEEHSFTSPVNLAPKLPSLDRVSEILDLAEGEDHR